MSGTRKERLAIKLVRYLFKQRWEYLWVEISRNETQWLYTTKLNYYGRYGWEAVSLDWNGNVKDDKFLILLKRRTRRWNVVVDDDEWPSDATVAKQDWTNPYWK